MDPGLTVKAILLQCLLDGPAYGQRLIAVVNSRSAGRVRLREGSLYPALRALEREGLLRSWVVKAAGARGRPRRYCELTQKGLAAAQDQRRVLAGLLQEGPAHSPSSAELQRMAARLRRCSDLSAILQELRRRTIRAAGAKA